MTSTAENGLLGDGLLSKFSDKRVMPAAAAAPHMRAPSSAVSWLLSRSRFVRVVKLWKMRVNEETPSGVMQLEKSLSVESDDRYVRKRVTCTIPADDMAFQPRLRYVRAVRCAKAGINNATPSDPNLLPLPVEPSSSKRVRAVRRESMLLKAAAPDDGISKQFKFKSVSDLRCVRLQSSNRPPSEPGLFPKRLKLEIQVFMDNERERMAAPLAPRNLDGSVLL